MESSVEIKDNSKKVLSEFEKQLNMGLESVGVTAERYAKKECPVDTGRLRNSIAYSVQGNDVYIGTNVVYAPQVEFRDIAHRTGKAHFLKDSALNHSDEYKKIVENALKA